MKDIRITYTYHKKDFDFDEEPTTGTIVLPVEENVAAELLISDLSQPIAGRHIGRRRGDLHGALHRIHPHRCQCHRRRNE